MQKKVKIPTRKTLVGVCHLCPRECRGREPDPPVIFGSDGKVTIECMAQEGKKLPTRTDIEKCTDCEYYYSSRKSFGVT